MLVLRNAYIPNKIKKGDNGGVMMVDKNKIKTILRDIKISIDTVENKLDQWEEGPTQIAISSEIHDVLDRIIADAQLVKSEV